MEGVVCQIPRIWQTIAMDIRQLRYFVGIADAGSMSAASIQLHIAQPALSQAIARLEDDIGAKLLIRTARGVELTPSGEALKEKAILILRDMEQAREAALAEAGGPVRGSVTIGLPTTVAMALTLPLLKGMSETYPSITLRLVESQSGHLLDWLLQGRIDIAILFNVSADGQKDRGIDVEPLVMEELHFVSRPTEPLDGAQDIAFADALDLPVLLPSREHALRRLLDNHAARLGRSWNVVAEVDALLHLKRAVAGGIAHTVLPKIALTEELLVGELQTRRIVSPVLRRTVMLALSWAGRHSKARLAAHALIQDIVKSMIASGAWQGAEVSAEQPVDSL